MFRKDNSLYTTNTLDDGFSVTVASLLLGLGAEVYIPIFKKYNLGKKDLEEITNEDLIIMGVDDPTLRKNILQLFHKKQGGTLEGSLKFTADDKKHIMKETTKVMELIKLSLNCCKRNLAYVKNPEDVLVKPNIYATDLMLETIQEIETKLRGIQSTLRKDNRRNSNDKKKKIQVLAASGAIAVIVFGVCYFKFIKFKI